MITKDQINDLKSMLEEDKKTIEEQLDSDTNSRFDNESARDTVGELSMYDNHPGDAGTELFEREKDQAIEEHQNEELDKVNKALQAIEDGTYGKCRECGKDLPFERLEAVPTALYCVDHAPSQHPASDRPAEEDVLSPNHDNHFNFDDYKDINDEQDSFEQAASYGTSETPSDFNGQHKDYNSLYDTDHNDEGFTEEYESFSATDIEGKNRRVVRSDTEEQYQQELEDENLDAPFGKVPYKKGDSYLEDKENK
ncbi:MULTISPECIES: TraR/DksA C4-type zinc finger protein [Bacillus]|uniref:TraR/DksA C4-type zinc finger protein n=1 Tax=Bacillus TaxID=1386 RepID=UPI000C7579B7|nr:MULTISPECIES: TraR/DksA C4-type zinc finger protein [Bacillus]PLR70052.1 molecular chaperone DnaK [Bacillus sp. UMB0728]RYI25235.1 molecular chaperone DnaK [Bacillus infantis]